MLGHSWRTTSLHLLLRLFVVVVVVGFIVGSFERRPNVRTGDCIHQIELRQETTEVFEIQRKRGQAKFVRWRQWSGADLRCWALIELRPPP